MIAEYIRAAPREGQPHLGRLYAILKNTVSGKCASVKTTLSGNTLPAGMKRWLWLLHVRRKERFDKTPLIAYVISYVMEARR